MLIGMCEINCSRGSRSGSAGGREATNECSAAALDVLWRAHLSASFRAHSRMLRIESSGAERATGEPDTDIDGQGRIAGISRCGYGTAAERHVSRKARERARDHCPHGRQDAKEPDPRAG